MSLAEKVFSGGLDIGGHLQAKSVHCECKYTSDVRQTVGALHLSYSEANLVADADALVQADIKGAEIPSFYEPLLGTIKAPRCPDSEIQDEGSWPLLAANESHPFNNGPQVTSTLPSWH
nr:hypothetical protein [Roseomonas sp. KE2513]